MIELTHQEAINTCSFNLLAVAASLTNPDLMKFREVHGLVICTSVYAFDLMENYNVTTEEVLNTIPEGMARNAAAETLKNINETITILRRNITG